MIQKLLNIETQHISAAAMIIAAASLVSRGIGIVRDRVLAGRFGAGAELDMYYAAFRIPDLLFTLLVLGALSAGFIPLFTKMLERDGSVRAWRFANEVLTLFLILFAVICTLLAFVAPFLVRWLAPGFSEAMRETTVTLTRFMLFSPLFLGISSVFSGVLHSFRRFAIAAAAPIFYNLGIIIGALFFVDRWGLRGLAFGVILGAGLHALIQLPSVFALGFRFHPVVAWNGEMRRLLTLMVPRTMTLAITQLVLVVITALATGLAEGRLAVFNLANNLQSFPIGIFGVSYAVAAFPKMSASIAAKNDEQFVRQFSSAMRQVFFFLVPSTVLLLTLKAQIVRVLLGTGAFDWEDTVLTLKTVEAFSLGLIAQAVLFVIIRAFWAFEDTVRPALVAFGSAVLTIALALYLRPLYGVQGLALAVSIGMIVQVIVLWVLLHGKSAVLDDRRIGFSVFRMMIAALFMIVSVQAMKLWVAALFGTATAAGVLAQAGAAACIGFSVYVGVLFMLGSEEARVFLLSIRRRIRPSTEQMALFEDV